MKLVFPEKILNQHLVVLGKTGAGKSSALRHIVEATVSQDPQLAGRTAEGTSRNYRRLGRGSAEGVLRSSCRWHRQLVDHAQIQHVADDTQLAYFAGSAAARAR